MVFDGFEVCLTEGIIIRDIGSRMAFFDAQITQKECQGFGFHWFAIIGMEGQLFGLDALVGSGSGDQLTRQLSTLVFRDHPAHDVAAEDVDHSVKREMCIGQQEARHANLPFFGQMPAQIMRYGGILGDFLSTPSS